MRPCVSSHRSSEDICLISLWLLYKYAITKEFKKKNNKGRKHKLVDFIAFWEPWTFRHTFPSPLDKVHGWDRRGDAVALGQDVLG